MDMYVCVFAELRDWVNGLLTVNGLDSGTKTLFA